MSEHTVAVFDCFSGIAGDMTLAALIDAGASLERIRGGLEPLGLPTFSLAVERVQRGGMEAAYLHVALSEERTFQPTEMRALVGKAALPARVKERALAAIDALAAGEAKAHRTTEPHFHEAGGVDALIDIVGAMLALEELGVGEAFCPLVTVGSGTITRSEHGPLPAAPGPAAAHILQAAGFPLRFVEASHELVTPSGAAILAAVAKPGPAVIVAQAHGCGAGSANPPARPNALRIFIGSQSGVADSGGLAQRALTQLEANIDDMPPSLLAHARDRLLEEGALDAWLEPIGMKKGRAAEKLCALVPAGDEERFVALYLAETTTLGVRAAAYRRWEAARAIEEFHSSLGVVRMKVRTADASLSAIPEFEDVKLLAAALNRPALEIQRTLEAEWRAAKARPHA